VWCRLASTVRCGKVIKEWCCKIGVPVFFVMRRHEEEGRGGYFNASSLLSVLRTDMMRSELEGRAQEQGTQHILAMGLKGRRVPDKVP